MSILKVIIIHFFVMAQVNGFAQSIDNYNENIRRIDAYANGPIKQYACDQGIKFPASYKASKIRSDLRIMSFINSQFNNKSIKPGIEKEISKVRNKKISIVKSVNGLIEANDITILGEYLWANVKLDFIDNFLVRSKVLLRTTTHGRCGSHTHLLDFKVVREYFIKDAKILFHIGYDEMTSDTIYSGNLALLAEQRKDYKFSIPGSSTEGWINEIFTKQYYTDSAGAYNYAIAPRYYIKLIKENKIAEVTDLLFSPNYITSVNAMEALLYLSSVNKVRLTKQLNDKMVEIKNDSFIIMQQGSSDVYYRRNGYKELRTTDERVIKKYSSSM
jgi:hypothetical protein